MTRNVAHMELRDSVESAVELMAQAKVSCVVVCREMRPKGILTERDVTMMYTSALPPSSDVSLETVMYSPIVSLAAQDSLGSVLDIVPRLASRHVPVVDGAGRLVGLLTQTELLAAYCGILRGVAGAPHSGG